MTEPTVVEVYDMYHCKGCNCKIGEMLVYSDETQEAICDVNIDCFHPYSEGNEGYSIKRENHEVRADSHAGH